MKLTREPSLIAIDILNRNKEIGEQMVDFMISKKELSKAFKNTKGLFGGGIMLREYFEATSKEIPNRDAMNNGIGLLLVQMEEHGFNLKLDIINDEEAYVVCEAYRMVRKMIDKKGTAGMGGKEKENYEPNY